jgi:dihydroorotase
MKQQNDNVTAEVTPHHIFFNEEDLITYDTNLKVAPPIRSEIDRMALISAAKDGTIDCIATDHAPHTVEDKETTFDLASFGMIGLESCFGVVNKVLCKESNMNLIDLICLLTMQPRNLMGFDSDLFCKGSSAEITIIDAEEDWIFSKEHIKSKSINSPYIGKKLIGKIKYTISKSHIYKNS